MKSFIKGRVVKSCNVQVSTPRIVENQEGFRNLGKCLAVLSVGAEGPNVATSECPDWLEDPLETKAKEQAAIILAEAKEKAAKILAEAESKAQEIRAKAESESELLRQGVAEATRAEVYPTAQAEGYQAGRVAGEAEGKLAFQDADKLFKLAQRTVQEEYGKVEEDLLHLAIKIAERLVRSSLAVEPERLLSIIQALTLLPEERVGWRLHVAPDDACWLEKHQPPCPCPWITDESLSSGDCFLECQEGVFDARLEAQLDKLEHTLREELQNGGLETIAADGGSD